MNDERLLPQHELAELAQVEPWVPPRARTIGLLEPVASFPSRQGGASTLYRPSDVLLLRSAQLLRQRGGRLPDALALAHRLRGLDGQAQRAVLERGAFARWPRTSRWQLFEDAANVPEGANVMHLRQVLQ